MDNVTSQIAHLVDELVARGVKHIRIKGFCGLDEIELTIASPQRSNNFDDVFKDDVKESFDDIQYAASGVVPMNIKEMYK